MHSAHCPKNNLNLCIKPEPVTFGADATVCLYIHMYGTRIYSILYCCFRSSSVRLGCHAEIQIIFGTVQQLHADANGSLYVSMCNIVFQSWHATTVSLQRVLGDKIASYSFCLHILVVAYSIYTPRP